MEHLKQQATYLNRVHKVVTGLTLLFYLLGAILIFTSCEKDKIEPLPNKTITVQVITDGLIQNEMTKSFSPNTWVYNYNPNPHTLTLTGENGNVYTFTKTIAELNTGFPITVIPGTYTVTYLSTHIPTTTTNQLSNTLDIGINETITITATAPTVTITANHKDYLIVVDMENMTNAEIMQSASWFAMFSSPVTGENYRYAYLNQLNNIDIRYTFYNTVTNQSQTVTKVLTNPQLNNIYHMINAFNGNATINILPFSYNTIGW